MRGVLRVAIGAGTVLGLTATLSGAAGAQGFGRHPHSGRDHDRGVVFVQTDALSGNQVIAYDRAPGGTLAQAGTYATGGLGGALNGSVVDDQASQGSLAFDPTAGLLLAVNAGSNSVSAFRVDGDRLQLVQVIGSGGTFPSSIATFGNLVYVLNATSGGSVSGFRVDGGGLRPLHDGTRALGLTTPTDATQFTHTPGQVAFTPDGAQLVVTTKATTSAIDVFGVRPDGRLSFAPTVNTEAGAVPFAVAFGEGGRLFVADAGTNAVSSFSLSTDGAATPLGSVATGEAATCWVTRADGVLFASNAGSGTLSTVTASNDGTLSLGATTPTDHGTVDAAATPGGRYLYVQTGASGIVDEFSIGTNAALTEVGTANVPGGAAGEGIVAL
jgi:6-phosphogluconolactonase (cycloisomerase 2 family)